MNEFEKTQSGRILACYGMNDLEKGGKGSGKYEHKSIGKTKSGKAIKENFNDELHDDFSNEDHSEAVVAHLKMANKYKDAHKQAKDTSDKTGKEANKELQSHYIDKMKHHVGESEKHKEAIK